MKYALIGSRDVLSSSRRAEATDTKRCEGFTLLETLIALVILAFALQALYETYSGGLRASKISDEHEQARVLAASLLAEHTSDRSFKKQSLEGSFENFSWRIWIDRASGINPAATPDPRWTLYWITAEVSWPPNRSVQLATVRLGAVNE